MKFKFNSTLIIYLLLAYVSLQLIWWGFSIIQLNKEIFLVKSELLNFKNLSSNNYYTELKLLQSKLHNRKIMIVTEGCVFLLLFFYVVQHFKKALKSERNLNTQQKNFLMVVTHELKSPIAAIKLQIDTLKKRQLEPSQQQFLLSNANSEIDRLTKLVDNILTSTALDEAQYPLNRQSMALSDLVNQIVDKYISIYTDKISIKKNVDVDINFFGDTNAITSIINNILDNAIKFVKENEMPDISISLNKIDDEIILKIRDNGIGILPDDIEKILEKFYRVGNERTRNTKGSGLGLFIVNHLVKMQNGFMKVTSNENNGTTVQVNFTA